MAGIKMIKTAGSMFDKKSPEDRDAMEALLEQLDREETEEDLTHLQDTINKIEESLKIIRERNFSEMSDEELQEVAEVVANLDKFKNEMNILTDQYLGQGALAEIDLPDDVYQDIKQEFGQPSEYLGWGARKPGDPEFGMFPPTIPLAEASFINELAKIANELDNRGLAKEADELDKIILNK